jgi:hypothetical protein
MQTFIKGLKTLALWVASVFLIGALGLAVKIYWLVFLFGWNIL